MRQGTRLREVRRGPFGRKVAAVVEVSAYEQNRRFDLKIVSGPLPIDGSHEFHETDVGTPDRLRRPGTAGRPAAVGRAPPRPRAEAPVQRLLRRRLKAVLESPRPWVW